MMYRVPEITAQRRAVLAEIEVLRAELGRRVVASERWVSSMQRQSRAAAYASSTRIEGFATSAERGAELLGDAAPTGRDDLAFTSYARAMQHVGVIAGEPDFAWSRRLLLDLHFDVCSFQSEAHPGALRGGPIHVTGPYGVFVFSGPPAEELPALVDEFVDWLSTDTAPPLVKAAMAHLNLVSIHPFEDGNGRVSRVIQSLVIARTGEQAPELGSIEEYLAAHTATYYAALASAQGGGFNPSYPAGEWVDFCLAAHKAQASSRIELVAAAARRWQQLERVVAEHGWPERMMIALEQSLIGGLTRARYAGEAEIAEPTASLDLRRLVDSGLVDVLGGGRSTRYEASATLKRHL